MTVRTRFAPSPTGYLHIGGARTALFSWLYARKHGGSFVLRIEDTDRERSTTESVNAILEGMTWLGLEYDEGPFYQTERMARYQEVIQQLLDNDQAYYCYCSKEELDALRAEQRAKKIKPRYDGRCRHRTAPVDGISPVIRFKNTPEGSTIVRDMVKGNVAFDNAELDDLIIARSDGTPTYNLTVVVDDMDMNISHVIRGDDHLNNTPRQMNILKALGVEPPIYAHLPMILGADGSRLSKRHGAVSVMQYREEGYLPEALLNYLARLGWSHGDQEIFSIEEMIELFDISAVNKAAAAFNPEKLLWLNQQYIKVSPAPHLVHHASWHYGQRGIDPSAGGPDIQAVVETQRDRARTLVELVDNSAFFYREIDQYAEKDAKKHLKPEVLPALKDLRGRLEALPDWQKQALHQAVVDTAEAHGLKMGKMAQPVRVALAGRAMSPSIDTTIELVGREQTLKRLDRAISYLQKQS
ncbi:MAG TPA: glutamate--tRNA ligase [Acidiferrobacteraceae bacterium]|nr:glutamate--tRNA ligase [Acidiferrobacteraceae bacterium]HEX19352.1 glutamate--tRNA ligase [Acidiferrobacteraceae bacterium]